MLGTDMSFITRSQRRTKKIVAGIVGAFLFSVVPSAAHAAESTFTFSGVAAEFAATGGLVFTEGIDTHSVSYSEDDDVTSFAFVIDNPGSEAVILTVSSASITGVADVTKNEDVIYVWPGSENYIRYATAPGNQTEGLTDAAVSISLEQLLASTVTSVVTGAPAGVTISSTGSYYFDEQANKTCVSFQVKNTSSKAYTLRYRGSVTHGSDTVQSVSNSYVYVAKKSTAYLEAFDECLPGNIQYNDEISIAGTLVKATATVIKKKKLTLPKGFSISMSANDIYYDAETNKSYINLRIVTSVSSTSVLRAVSMKLNGKKITGAVVNGGYADLDINKKVYNLYFGKISGDYRAGKSLTFTGKIKKEKKTALSVAASIYDRLGSGYASIPDPTDWTYDAKKNVTQVTLILYNSSDANITVNFSNVKLVTKIKKKGKFKEVTFNSKIKSKVVTPSGFGPSWGGTIFEIPGDVRSNGKAIRISGISSAS